VNALASCKLLGTTSCIAQTTKNFKMHKCERFLENKLIGTHKFEDRTRESKIHKCERL